MTASPRARLDAASTASEPDVVVAFTLNGEPMGVPHGTTLTALLDRCGQAPHSVATSVNGQFVARAARAAHVLASGDQVMTFQPIVGG
jgi:sulfur carrier protein